MARYNNIDDDQIVTPAVEPQAPAVVFSLNENKILYSQTVSVFVHAHVEFSQASILAICTAARSCQLGGDHLLFMIGTVLLKLNFMTLGVEKSARFEKQELELIVEWLTRAVHANVYNQEERFIAQMTLINIREMLFPAIVEVRKENRRQTRREAEEDIFGLD